MIDEYLKTIKPEQREALEKLRAAIRKAAPGAEECLSYGMPAFRLNGQLIAGFRAAAKHCAYFPMSGSVVDTMATDLKDYDTSKGTIRFQPSKPLPTALIKKLIKARIAERITQSEPAFADGAIPAPADTRPHGCGSDAGSCRRRVRCAFRPSLRHSKPQQRSLPMAWRSASS